MSSHYDQTIAELQKKLREQEVEVIKTKDMINRLCEFAGKPVIYTDTELQPSAGVASIRSDQFYGQPLATAVRQILEMRQSADLGPATVRELYETLREGGYHFETKDEKNAMRGLRISLSKNVALFHKLPNGRFGLLSWYPKAKRTRVKLIQNEHDNQQESIEDPNIVDAEGDTVDDWMK